MPIIGLNDITNRTGRTPHYIASWIHDVCEKEHEIMVSPNKGETPSKRKRREKPATWSHALKMRAAASFGFVTEFDCDPSSWMQMPDGTFYGNPSLSKVMTTYMKSLRKKKVSSTLYLILGSFLHKLLAAFLLCY